MVSKVEIFILLLVLLFPFSVNDAIDSTEHQVIEKLAFEPPDLPFSEPIDINGEHDFNVTFGHTGNGTAERPYIIENVLTDINKTDTDSLNPVIKPAIYIKNTRSHFIIRNCIIRGWGRFDPPGFYEEPHFNLAGSGIRFQNVTNGVVSNNTLIINQFAIGGFDFHNCNFTNNWIYGNFVQDNSEGEGIDLNSNTSGNIVANNTIQMGGTGILLAESSNNIVENNSISSCYVGISLKAYSISNSVSFNNCSDNIENGIALGYSSNNLISNNTCMLNIRSGICLSHNCHNNTISGNLLAFNGEEYPTTVASTTNTMSLSQSHEGYGFWIEHDDMRPQNRRTKFHWNDVIGNTVNAKNDDTDNGYDYNFWSDYNGTDDDGDGIGDADYLVSGAAPASDLNPRITTRFPELLQLLYPDIEPSEIELTNIILVLIIVISSIALVTVIIKKRS